VFYDEGMALSSNYQRLADRGPMIEQIIARKKRFGKDPSRKELLALERKRKAQREKRKSARQEGKPIASRRKIPGRQAGPVITIDPASYLSQQATSPSAEQAGG